MFFTLKNPNQFYMYFQMKISSEIPIMEPPPPFPIPIEENTEEPKAEGFGVLYPVQKTEEKKQNEEEADTDEKCITAEELAANRIPARGNFFKMLRNKFKFAVIKFSSLLFYRFSSVTNFQKLSTWYSILSIVR